jgi:hypothetical protein
MAAIMQFGNMALANVIACLVMVIMKEGTPQNAPLISPLYKPLAYPLLFLHGKMG